MKIRTIIKTTKKKKDKEDCKMSAININKNNLVERSTEFR